MDEQDPFLADCDYLLAADLRKSLPTKGAYQDALREAVARLKAAAAPASEQEVERWADDHFTQGEVAVVMRLYSEFGWRKP